MASPREDARATMFIDALKNERMKTHVKRDGSGRPILIYEAPVHIQDGDLCLVTVYDYTGTASSSPTNTLERISEWDADWDSPCEAVLANGDVGYTDP